MRSSISRSPRLGLLGPVALYVGGSAFVHRGSNPHISGVQSSYSRVRSSYIRGRPDGFWALALRISHGLVGPRSSRAGFPRILLFHPVSVAGNQKCCRRRSNRNKGFVCCRVNCWACFRYRAKARRLYFPFSDISGAPGRDFTLFWSSGLVLVY